MTHKPTINPPAAPSGPQEDYRVTVARKAIVESTKAKGTDRSAYEMWGFLEGTVKGLLEVIDEGSVVNFTTSPDLDSLSDDELAEQLEAEIRAMRPRLDEMERRLLERRS
jgi:hypothetical protein